MATLKTNRLIPVMAISFAMIVAIVVFKINAGTSVESSAVSAGEFMSRAPKPRTADADTPNDTIRALRGQMNEVSKNVERTQTANEKLLADRDRVIEEKRQADAAYQEQLKTALKEQDTKTSRRIETILGRLNEAVNGIVVASNEPVVPVTRPNTPVMPLPQDIPEGFGLGLEAGVFVSGEEMIEVFWIEPLDESINQRQRLTGGSLVQQDTPAGNSTVNAGATNAKKILLQPLQDYRDVIKRVSRPAGVSRGRSRAMIRPANRVAPKRQVQRVEPPTVKRVFTIPDLSMLAGSTAITSLVGRIYPDGNVVEPRLFKLIVGRDNFTANFIELPLEIEGMIFEGYAVGDFTSRCVSGNLIAATFVFEDGTTRSMYPGDPGSRPGHLTQSARRIGYITDRFGNPCVSGRLITDAKTYLGTAAALAAAGATASGIREAQQNVTERIDPATGEVSNRRTDVQGSLSRYALSSGINAGLDKSIEWLDEMYRASQSVIYAPAGAQVDVHIQQELRIDITPQQRQLRYSEHARTTNDLD